MFRQTKSYKICLLGQTVKNLNLTKMNPPQTFLNILHVTVHFGFRLLVGKAPSLTQVQDLSCLCNNLIIFCTSKA